MKFQREREYYFVFTFYSLNMARLTFKKTTEWFRVFDKKLETETLLPLEYNQLSDAQKKAIRSYLIFSKIIGFFIPPVFYLGYRMRWFWLAFVVYSFLPVLFGDIGDFLYWIIWIINGVFIVMAWGRFAYQAWSRLLLKRAYFTKAIV